MLRDGALIVLVYAVAFVAARAQLRLALPRCSDEWLPIRRTQARVSDLYMLVLLASAVFALDQWLRMEFQAALAAAPPLLVGWWCVLGRISQRDWPHPGRRAILFASGIVFGFFIPFFGIMAILAVPIAGATLMNGSLFRILIIGIVLAMGTALVTAPLWLLPMCYVSLIEDWALRTANEPAQNDNAGALQPTTDSNEESAA